MLLLWSGVVRVRSVGNQLIIYYFNVNLQLNCGIHFFTCLVLIGLYLEGRVICWEVGGAIGKSSCFANLKVGSFMFN
jgi:hypothetical protein